MKKWIFIFTEFSDQLLAILPGTEKEWYECAWNWRSAL